MNEFARAFLTVCEWAVDPSIGHCGSFSVSQYNNTSVSPGLQIQAGTLQSVWTASPTEAPTPRASYVELTLPLSDEQLKLCQSSFTHVPKETGLVRDSVPTQALGDHSMSERRDKAQPTAGDWVLNSSSGAAAASAGGLDVKSHPAAVIQELSAAQFKTTNPEWLKKIVGFGARVFSR